MYDIHMEETTKEFFECWCAAAMHIDRLGTDKTFRWLKSELSPPYLEHLSFALGNQLFFLHVVDVDVEVSGPGLIKGLRSIAKDCNGYCCIIPMKLGEQGWKPAHPGWGILDTPSLKPLCPPDVVTDEKILMTDWEVHDFAVQIVGQVLEKEGKNITTKQGTPDVDPSIWFEGDDGLEWVVVRSARYPNPEPKVPEQWDHLVEHCSKLSQVGHFAGVGLVNAEDYHEPLWRGGPMNVRFTGLERPEIKS